MKDRKVKRKKSGCKRSLELPEEIWDEILARLPFRSITKFKTVCRRWREVSETECFRRKFMFAHRNCSSSWSIMHWTFGRPYEEVVGFYGCQRYGIPRSLNSYILPQTVDNNLMIAFVDGLVLLKTKSSKKELSYSVGNPVLNQWVQLPPHPSQEFNTWGREPGLVTRVEDGVVVEYKVIFMDAAHLHQARPLIFYIYSSKTGKWIRKPVKCPLGIDSLSYRACLSLNKKLHWLNEHQRVFVVYDFFATYKQHKCQVIPFPDDKTCFGRTYSTCGGFLVYISKNHFNQLKLWRLEEYTSDSGRWQLMHEIDPSCFDLGYYNFPLAMHPFKTHIIYMGTYKRTLVSIDLKTYKRTHYAKSSDTMLSHYKSRVNLSLFEGRHHKIFYAPQFILPQWMESVPQLPSL